jgi:serine phosphatase RsbU (regulator of sigma subunit)
MNRSLKTLIFTRLMLFVFSFFICSIFVLFYFFKRIDEIHTWGDLLTNLEIQLLKQENIRNNFIRIETINPSFFKTGKSDYINANKKKQEEIETIISKLNSKKINLFLTNQSREIINNIHSETYINQTLFDSLNILVKKRGFKDWGIEGQMRNCAHDLEKFQEISYDVLQLRRREKDFIIRIQPEYVDSVKNIVARIQHKVFLNSSISNLRKKQIDEKLYFYLQSFLLLAELDIQLGIKNMTGITSEIQNHTEVVNLEFKTLYSISNKKQNDVIHFIILFFIILILSFSIISFIIIYSISTRITKPFNQLAKHIDDFNKSNFNKKTNICLKNATKDVERLLENFSLMEEEIIAYINEFKEKVEERTREIRDQKNIIQTQNKNIIDSINSAKKIQLSMLQEEATLQTMLPELFVLYIPKDIVSGDFYYVDWKWSSKENAEILYFIAADATGHGIPGALMSMLGLSLIKSILSVDNDPQHFIHVLNEMLYKHLHKKQKKIGSLENIENFDLALCCINFKTLKLQYQGANRPCFIVRDSILHELKRDIFAIGEYSEVQDKVKNQEFQLQSNDMIFIFSDGYASQFNDANNKKYNIKKFKDFLTSISNDPIEIQKIKLNKEYKDWKGNTEQTDDILIMGLRIK